MAEQTTEQDSTSQPERLERQAETAEPDLLRELLDFLLTNKKWWLTPIILVLLLVGLILIAGGSSAAPFVYTLF